MTDHGLSQLFPLHLAVKTAPQPPPHNADAPIETEESYTVSGRNAGAYIALHQMAVFRPAHFKYMYPPPEGPNRLTPPALARLQTAHSHRISGCAPAPAASTSTSTTSAAKSYAAAAANLGAGKQKGILPESPWLLGRS
jgi:hypothetical protein